MRANATTGWGTASDGNTWALLSGTASPGGMVGISANRGIFSQSSASLFTILGAAVSSADQEGLVRWSVDSSSATAGILLRAQNSNNYYLARYNGANAIEFYKKVGGVKSVTTALSFTPTVGTFYWLRFRVQGTTIALKVWADGTAEPSSWGFTTTDTALSSPGGVGLYGYATTSTPNCFDSFTVMDVTPGAVPNTPTDTATSTPTTPTTTPMPTATSTSSTASLSGVVTDATTGVGIANALVTDVTGVYTATTDATGDYTIITVLPGTFALIACAAGYSSASQPVTATTGTVTVANFSLQPLLTATNTPLPPTTTSTPTATPSPLGTATPTVTLASPTPTMTDLPSTGTISGTVTDAATGVGISAAAVTTDNGIYSTTTDATGTFILPAVAPNSYTVTVAVSGYASASQSSVAVTVGAITTVEFSLTPSAVVPTATPTDLPTATPTAAPTDLPTATAVPRTPVPVLSVIQTSSGLTVQSLDAQNTGWQVSFNASLGGGITSSQEITGGVHKELQYQAILHSLVQSYIHVGGVYAANQDQPGQIVVLRNTPQLVVIKTVSTNPQYHVTWTYYYTVWASGQISIQLSVQNSGTSTLALATPDSLQINLDGFVIGTYPDQAPLAWHALKGTVTSPVPTSVTPIDADLFGRTPPGTSGTPTLGFLLDKVTPWAAVGASTYGVNDFSNTTRGKVQWRGTLASMPAGKAYTFSLLLTLRRNLSAGQSVSMDADYRMASLSVTTGTVATTDTEPTTTTLTQGFNQNTGAYVIMARMNHVTAQLNLPNGVTTRWTPRFKIVAWSKGAPLVTWGGQELVAGADYAYALDPDTATLYLRLAYDVVGSNPGLNQRLGALLDVS